MARPLHHSHHASHSPIDNAELIPESVQLLQRLESPLSGIKSLFRRGSSDPTDGSSNGSGSQSSPASQSNNVTISVALGVVIPLVLAIGIFVYLHRRHVRKLRKEDLNDPHKSLDFGWHPSNAAPVKGRNKSGKNKPETTVADLGTEKDFRRERGFSMDMDLPSPYLLPGLQGSRESLHSMSRMIHSQDDRYRPASNYNPNDTSSLHSNNTWPGADDASSSNESAFVKRGPRDEMEQDLLKNPQGISKSVPPTDRAPLPHIQVAEAAKEVPRKALLSPPKKSSDNDLSPGERLMDARESYVAGDDLRKSNIYLGAFIHSREPSSDIAGQKSSSGSANAIPKQVPNTPGPTNPKIDESPKRKLPPPVITTEASHPLPLPSREQSSHASKQASIEQNFYEDASEYDGEGPKVTSASPQSSQPEHYNITRSSSQAYMPPIDEHSFGNNGHPVHDADVYGYDVQRLSMGFRPLPPDDPTDNPEQRANRIRSFYKEYFDDSKPGPKSDYYEDYDQGYLGDGVVFDPASGQFISAQTGLSHPQYVGPYGRRAMTPPPRAPPHFGRKHAATVSNSSRLMPPGPRAYSSASGRLPPPGQGPPKKAAPPPQPLRALPTPHLLKEDAFTLPIDFAPPTSAKERQAGRPESPRGGMRPYSPAVRAHRPLATSFDDLAVMPSPHLLRKSGMFMALDFAAPPRFRSQDNVSDAGSIRSNRSGVSAVQQNAIRKGAYRVSRIPREVVGTKTDLMSTLKPSWNMHSNSGTIGMST